MLEQLLEMVAAGSMQSLDELAKQMDVPASMIDAMLGDLERMEFLNKLEASCDTACSGCPSQGMCSIIGGGTLWSVTEKGMEAAARLGST